MAGVDYYDLLGVSPQASSAEVKSAYRRLAKALHPDAGGNSALFRLVTEAYDTLADPDRRAGYDRDRASPAHPAGHAAERSARSADPQSGSSTPGQSSTAQSSASDRSDAGSPRTESRSAPADGQPSGESETAAATDPRLARPATNALPWWEQIDPAAEVIWVPRFGRWRLPFLLSAAAWLILLGLLLAPAASRRGGPGLLDFLALAPLSYVIAATAGWRLPRPLVLAAYLWATGFAAFGVYTIRTDLLSGCWLLALALGTVLLPRLGQRYLSQRAMDRVFTREFRGFNVFGEPNNAHSGEPNNAHSGEPNNGHSGRPNGHSPLAGPELTAELLTEYLTRSPGVRIFHRLDVPGPGVGEVDHAVLCGHRLVLINSMVWAPAHYAIDEFGNVLRDGRQMTSRVPDYPDVLDRYRNLLPRLEIQGVVLVHPSGTGELVCSAPLHTPVAMMTPASFVQTIGEWLAQTPYTVDRNAFLTVLGQLRH